MYFLHSELEQEFDALLDSTAIFILVLRIIG